VTAGKRQGFRAVSGMNIQKISILKYERKFQISFRSSHTNRTNPESVILCVDFDNGVRGFGESTPRDYVTGETCDSVVDCIRNTFAPLLIGKNVDSLNDAGALLDKVESECAKTARGPYNSALGAVDIALIDAVGKHLGKSASECLGPKVRDEIQYSVTLPFMPLDKIEKLFVQMKDFQFRFIKILISPFEDENVARVKKIRSLMGDDVDIRIEANGTLPPETCLKNVRNLMKYNISAIEQPVPKDDIKGMKRFRKKVDVPVIADESLCSMADLKMIVEHEACDIINIKLSKCGGILRSKKMAAFAYAHGLGCQMGAHVGETVILGEAGRAFAMTTPDLKYIEGCSFLLFQNALMTKKFCEKPASGGFGLGLADEDNELILRDSSLAGIVGS